jgi:hypothetical protein
MSRALLMPVNLTTWKVENGKISIGDQLQQIRSQLPNNKSKIDWRCGSSGRSLKALSSNSIPTKKKSVIKDMNSQVLVAHTCNPRYSGGRDQEDHGLKPAQANSSRDPILKNPSQKKNRASEGSEFKPQYCKRKKDMNAQYDRMFYLE